MDCSIRKKAAELYLDFVNNFLTIARFAEYYGFTHDRALWMLTYGNMFNKKRTK